MKNPDRVVVDLPGVARGTVPGETPGAGDIARVRVSLFQASPVVTRVVLDMKTTAPKVAVDPDGDGLTVLLGQSRGTWPRSRRPRTRPRLHPRPLRRPSSRPRSRLRPRCHPGARRAGPGPGSGTRVHSRARRAGPGPGSGARATSRPPRLLSGPPAPQEMAAVQPAPVQAPPPAEAKAAAESLDKIKVDLSPIDPKAKEFKGYEDLFVAQDTRPHAAEGKTIIAGGVPLSFKEKTISGGEAKYTGEPISLSLKDADVKDVLRVFHDISKMNIVVHPAVQGKVTVDLENVPWDQAMDIILKNNGLDYIYENNVIWVAPAAEIARKFADVQRLQKEQLNAEQPVTFTQAPLLRQGEQDGEHRQDASCPTRATSSCDDRTNTLIIEEVPSTEGRSCKLIDSLDTATPQVLIEARIVETTITWNQSFGVVWSGNWYTARLHGQQYVTHQPGTAAHGGQYGCPAQFQQHHRVAQLRDGRLRRDPPALGLQRLHRPGSGQHHRLLLPGRPAGRHGERRAAAGSFRPRAS